MSKVRVVYDLKTKVMAWLPPDSPRIDLGRETYGGIPVPMSPRRTKGDATKIEALFRNFTEEEKKELLRLLHGLSRKHAVLALPGEETRLTDAGSRNGVTLKGVGIGGADKKLAAGEDFLLKNGTVFELGAWPLQFFDDPGDIEKLRLEKPGIYAVMKAP
jgi:hypothetical protein